MPKTNIYIPNSGLQAILFDFDGTLALQSINFNEMRQRVLQLLSQELDSKEANNFSSLQLPVIEMLNAACAGKDTQEAERLQLLAEQEIRACEHEAAKNSALFPYTIDVLKNLMHNNIQCAIVSRNCREAIESVFPQHADFCNCLLSRDDVNKVKPDPEHLLAALQQMGVSPERAMMVGDHDMDIIAGKNACCLSAGVYSGESKKEELAASKPDFLAKNISELFKF